MSETHSCKNTFRITTSLTETILKKDFAAVEQVNSSSAPLGKDCSQHMSQRLQLAKKWFQPIEGVHGGNMSGCFTANLVLLELQWFAS